MMKAEGFHSFVEDNETEFPALLQKDFTPLLKIMWLF